MISLFAKTKTSPLNLLTLPTYCVPNKESSELAAKREAQLRWMRDKGMKYLGDPRVEMAKRPKRQPAITSMRLVSVAHNAAAPGVPAALPAPEAVHEV